MKGQLSVLALASQAAAFAVPRVPPSEGIVGGEPANIQDFPYQVNLQKNNGAWCGGTIVSSRYIVTAAHCVSGTSNPTSVFSVRVGSDDVKAGTSYKLSEVIIHPKYSGSTSDNDVAILKVASDLQFGSTVKALPLTDSRATDGVNSRVSGWGATSEGGSYPAKLRYVDVPIISNADCNKEYSGKITARMVCAGFPKGGKDSCQGDSGGPLVQNGKLVGVVSWGQGCARAGKSGVYADVGNADLRKFIKEKTGL